MLETALVTHSTNEISVYSLPAGDLLFSTRFKKSFTAWTYIKNNLPSDLESVLAFLEAPISLPTKIENWHERASRVCAFDTKKGRMVLPSSDHAMKNLRLLDVESKSDMTLCYPTDSLLVTNDIQCITSLTMDRGHVVAGCFKGKVLALGFQGD
jgi:hypothetical protein